MQLAQTFPQPIVSNFRIVVTFDFSVDFIPFILITVLNMSGFGWDLGLAPYP